MLQRLDLDYVDLLYLHQPVGDVKAGWKNMENAVRAGKVRCLGLSNFEVAGAEDLYRWCVDSTEIKPVILQMECHPYAQRVAEAEQIRKDGMAVATGMSITCRRTPILTPLSATPRAA